jgi:hypothetical protein
MAAVVAPAHSPLEIVPSITIPADAGRTGDMYARVNPKPTNTYFRLLMIVTFVFSYSFKGNKFELTFHRK